MNDIKDFDTIRAEEVLTLKENMNWPCPPKDDDKRDWAVYKFQLQLRHSEIRRYFSERQ